MMVAKQSAKIESDFNDHQRFLEKMVFEKVVCFLGWKKSAAGDSQTVLTMVNTMLKSCCTKPINDFQLLKQQIKQLMKTLIELKDPFENQIANFSWS